MMSEQNTLHEFGDISYLPSSDPATHDPLRSFDLYVPTTPKDHTSDTSLVPSPTPTPVICFVHGGAWRSEDKSDHALLARRLAVNSGYTVAVPNYRLTKPTSPHRHPTHSQDLLAFLEFILTWGGPSELSQKPFDPSRLYLLGHSCSAHMLTSIFLTPPTSSSTELGSLTPSTELLESTRGIVLSEGIYDIDLLLKSFPTYKEWFIAATFEDLPSYSEFNTTTYLPRKGGEHIRWLVLHSSGDTLVDVIQSESMYNHLLEVGNEMGSKVEFDGMTLVAEHNQILKEEVYPQLVSAFVTRDTQ